MRQLLIYTMLLIIPFSCAKGQDIPNAEWQIKTAVLAAPEEYRAASKVYGYDNNGDFTTLREGSNAYICLADDPIKKGFSTAAYHKDLDAFMARGRALKAEGKDGTEIFEIREEEVKSGKLKMPDKATLAVLTGDIDPETKTIENSYTRYVFYVPFATGESTGLPETATPPGQPWLMNAGTHRAHIMITPPKK